MNGVRLGDLQNLSIDFLPAAHADPYHNRNRQQSDPGRYRALQAEEIEILVKNGNRAENWNKVLVTDAFDANRVQNCEFFGLVRIGDLGPYYLEFHDLRLPVGLVNCLIVSCDIGNQVVLRNIRLIAHYIIGDCCLLFNIDELTTTSHAKFGVGTIKKGEKEDVRVWLELGNENGGRAILPFADLLPADAWLWSKFRGNRRLMQRLKELTERTEERQRGIYGQIDHHTVIKNSRIIKDARIGAHAYIKGANKLKNITILSSAEEATQIGEGVELVNGIVGYGSRIFYGAKGVRFVTGRHTQLKYGARLINSVLGDNSTVSCCEILNNLIFPFHEQHHNNSFLIAATILGQSNIAANATIGSNHNSRSPDGEIVAGRGFWPGLGVTLKHNSRFASFVLISNGRYSRELDISIPFSLVGRDESQGSLQVMPGYWFLYNMYAVTRNSWKFKNRDKRVVKAQHIETELLAPDTIEEMFTAIDLLRPAIGKALAMQDGTATPNATDSDWSRLADSCLCHYENRLLDPLIDIQVPLQVTLDGLENSPRPAKIIKPLSGVLAFRSMIHAHALSVIMDFIDFAAGRPESDSAWVELKTLAGEKEERHWYNLGGQIVPQSELERLVQDIVDRRLSEWPEVHRRYNELWDLYPRQKAIHALHCLQRLRGKAIETWQTPDWHWFFDRGLKIHKRVLHCAVHSRQKDYSNPFRRMVYADRKEMEAVLGRMSENPFLATLRNDFGNLQKRVEPLLNWIASSQ
ncbi:DUF4954 family protein [candidate division KSB1 bacterium]|nr:DUF4954 family protein [candidate division KSB1 bacterium]